MWSRHGGPVKPRKPGRKCSRPYPQSLETNSVNFELALTSFPNEFLKKRNALA